jgi:signal transduction histidine kinase
MGEPSQVSAEAAFARTVVRVTAVLVGATLVVTLPGLFADPPWQRVVSYAIRALLVPVLWWSFVALRAGQHRRALELLYIGVFTTPLLSIPITRGTNTALALAITAFVLSTASRVLPAARTTAWVYGAVALGLVISLFDVIRLPTQLVDVDTDDRFLVLVFTALGLFTLILIHQFPRYPVRAKLTVGFLAVAVAPLLLFAGVSRSLGPDSSYGTHLAAIAAAAVASVVAFLFGQVIARPLVQVAEAMERFTAGDGAARAPVRVNDELGAVADGCYELAEQTGRLLASLRTEVGARTAKEAELQALNAALATARDQADAASRAKSSFLAQMSHELRTPLNAVIGYTQLIAEEAEARGQAEIHADAGRVIFAANHLLGLIGDILDLSKIEAGHGDLICEDFDAVAVARDTFEASTSLMRANGNTASVVAEVETLAMYSDARKLRQALLNLLGNAAKFSRDARVLLTIRARPDEAVFDDRAEGSGLAEARLPELFQPFAQLDSSFSRRYDGSGLGLAITSRFCQLMGGRVSVVSKLGAGSTFTIHLPLRAPEQSNI